MAGHLPIQLPPDSFSCAGAAVLPARICRELRIQKLVNAMVKYDVNQCRVSPGTVRGYDYQPSRGSKAALSGHELLQGL